MGAWDVGPFENDGAADWSGELEDAAPDARPDLVIAALTAAADEEDYLEVDVAQAAIAAAAIVAAQLPGGAPIQSTYAPDFLLEGERIALPASAAPLAVRALDRIMADESEWRSLWGDAFEGEAAFAVVADIRAVLDGSR